MAKILAFAGATRRDSFNKKLIRVAAEKAKALGAEVTLIDLADWPLPLYDGDLEERDGAPPKADDLYQLFLRHDALMISCPEYNSSITGVLKNTIDWVSRQREGDAYLAAYAGKVVGLLAASPGALGGLRGLVHVRDIFENIGAIVIPNQLAVPKANEAFAEDGSIKDAGLVKKIESLAKDLVETTNKLTAK